jgi:hypothetical protein
MVPRSNQPDLSGVAVPLVSMPGCRSDAADNLTGRRPVVGDNASQVRAAVPH